METVNKDLEALLAVQAQDAGIRALNERGDGLAARERELDDERAARMAAVERSRQALEREADRQGTLQAKVTTHRELQQRNLAQLDQVRRLREATAAQTQVEMARQILEEEERELNHVTGRLRDLRAAVAAHEDAVRELEEEQTEQRAQLAAEREALGEELARARRERDAGAASVSRSVLSRYERIVRHRGGQAVFPIRGTACGACDTAIPLQRRNQIADGARIEVCEGCGVLLYATSD